MEHDGKCEREGVARATASRGAMTRAEFNFIVSDEMWFGIACLCAEREACKFPEPVEKGLLRKKLLIWLAGMRKDHGVAWASRTGRQLVWEAGHGRFWQEARAEGRGEGGQIIRIDFEKRRRID